MSPVPADAGLMRSALGLARRGLGRVWPNPAVGCLIIDPAGRVVGRGWTAPGGRPHAETVALAAAGPLARGATAYVTLEPCDHTGRTPPCSLALIAAGVARVVVAVGDPDPRVDGRGIARLREAGILVDVGCLADEAAALNQGFLTRLTLGRPFLTLKLAASLDGRIATAAGESRWITGPRARAEVHLMRAEADAVMVGAGTARADDPRLDVRGLGAGASRPVRVVASRDLDLPLDSALGRSATAQALWIGHGPDAPAARRAAWGARGADLIELPAGPGGIDPRALLAALGARGITRLFCEGGGRLAAALLSADLVDEVVLYTSGLALGSDGRAAVGPLGLPSLAAAPHLVLQEAVRVGADLRSRWRRSVTDGNDSG